MSLTAAADTQNTAVHVQGNFENTQIEIQKQTQIQIQIQKNEYPVSPTAAAATHNTAVHVRAGNFQNTQKLNLGNRKKYLKKNTKTVNF